MRRAAPWLLAAATIAVQAGALLAMGLPAICACGFVDWWHGNPSGPQTSQHLTDWYTVTHVLHGIAFYLLLWLVAPRMGFGPRFALAIGLESAWEMIENTPMVMERYRQSALARGYSGDSVINSVADTLAAAAGVIMAWRLPIWATVVFVVAVELILGAMIRDNLTLNIVQLIHPSEALSRWQMGR